MEVVHEMLLCLRQQHHNRPVLHVGKETVIPLSAITYLEQQGHNIVVHLADGGQRTFYGQLDNLAPLGTAFVRSQKSFIVNLDYVIGLDKELSIFRLINGGVAHIRKGLVPQMRQRYEDRLIERVRLA